MSQTRIICETCRNPQCYCTCKNAPSRCTANEFVLCPVCQRGDVWREAVNRTEYVYKGEAVKDGKEVIDYLLAEVSSLLMEAQRPAAPLEDADREDKASVTNEENDWMRTATAVDAVRETLLDGTRGVFPRFDAFRVRTDTWIATVIQLRRIQKQCEAYGETLDGNASREVPMGERNEIK